MRARGQTEAAWIWSPRADVAVFGGSAAAALLLVPFARVLWDEGGSLPPWGWLFFVVFVDVAHVHTTLFRTYFDKIELRRRPFLYALLPCACFAAGVALHLISHLAFWRALAYLAIVHFVRQQIGWIAIYRARSGFRSLVDRVLDDGVIYCATGFPMLWWHAHLPRAFRWFVEGDLLAAPSFFQALVGPGALVYALFGAAYAARAVQLAATGQGIAWGKHLLVVTTAATWYVGIVATNSDFEFTVANVLVHGVPYIWLLWVYARKRQKEAPKILGSRIIAFGFGAFLATVLFIAFTEEVLWDRLVWHDRPLWFGGARHADTPLLGPLARAFVVPLLAVPQATHYLLDALLWRRRDTGAAQAQALGFQTVPDTPS